jgi:Pentapeptide repeats (8 copies)
MIRRPFTERGLVWIIVGGMLVFLFIEFLIVPGYGVHWTGFGGAEVKKETTRFAASGEQTGTDLTIERQNPRTIWDWIAVLGVGALLAAAVPAVGYFFARHQRKRDEQNAREREQVEALQAFFDQMSDLMIVRALGQEDERPDNDPKRKVAQARALSILLAMDEAHKRSPLKLVYELGLIEKDAPLISLSNASLRGAKLDEVALCEASLRHADLRIAALSGANLRGSDLSAADLRGAQLSNVNLSGADLTDANLVPYDAQTPARLSIHNLKDEALGSEKDLSRTRLLTTATHLTNTNLQDATLSGAILANTDLSQVRGLTQRQINQALGNKATKLPRGLQPPPDWEQSIEHQIGNFVISRLNDLEVRVNALVTSEILDPSQGNVLTTNLITALEHRENNDIQAAIDQLKEFTNQVKTLVRSNTLIPNQGRQLVRQANGILSLL